MSVEVQTSVPQTLSAGDTLNLSLGFSGYPATTHTLQFVLSTPGKAALSASGTADGDNFTLTLAGADTVKLTAGRWQWAAYVTSDGQRQLVETGTITITPNLAGAQGLSFAAQALENLEAAILKLTTGTNDSVSINGQTFQKRNLKEYLENRDKLREEVNREAALATGRGQSRNILTRFC